MRFGSDLEPSWGRLGAILGDLGPSWVHLGAVLGPAWGHLGASGGRLGASLGALGAILGPFLAFEKSNAGMLKMPKHLIHIAFLGPQGVQDSAKLRPSCTKLGLS